MSKEALYIDGLTVSFGAFRAINNLSMIVKFGEIRGIIGPNGAGKTTLLDVLTGKTRPRSGRVLLDGALDLLALSEAEITLSGVGRKFQKPSIFEALTVAENLGLALRSRQRSIWGEMVYTPDEGDRAHIQDVLGMIGMKGRGDLSAGKLSHGQKQWLEIGMLLIQRPKVLLLDEPVAGMTDEETERTVTLIRALRSPERAILVIEHDMAFVQEVADLVSVLHEGRMLLEGPMERVRADPAVIEVYLGR